MNADIPFIHCWVRRDFISSDSGLEEAYAFAIQSVYNRSIGFHVMLKSGAHYRNVPIHGIALSEDAELSNLSNLAYWDCFSNSPKVTVFDYLRDHECIAYLPDGSKINGVYLFTIDWLPDDPIRPGFINVPDQNKCGHVIALDNGNMAMLPTNKIAWKDGYFIGANPAPEENNYLTQDKIYQAESSSRDFSKSKKYFY